MTTANRIESPRPNPVAAGRTSPPQAPDVDRAYAILLTEEALTAAAAAVFASATPKGGTDRRQFERARLKLRALPFAANRVAGLLDVPGGVDLISMRALEVAHNAIKELGNTIDDAMTTVRAIDAYGEVEGLGLAAIHADVTLAVALEQLERADELICHAMFTMFLHGHDWEDADIGYRTIAGAA